jgi:general secretion pathway protein A
MYEGYYGFRERPFALSPDPKYLYLSETHREVLGHLVYGVREGEGFMAISGEVGTGKTTLCRTLLERLDHCDIAFLFNPTLTPTDLIKGINSEFGLSTFGDSRAELIDVLNTHLLERHHEGHRVLVIIDEAQNLPDETLEQLRLLGNLESQTEKLLQIVLIGQPELDRKLEARKLRQLRQRISVWWHLGSLSSDETRGYVRHRLRAAGGDRAYFTVAALDALHKRSGGVPRLINVLAERSLLAGYGDQRKVIPAELVQAVADELRSRPTPRQIRRRAVGLGLGGAAAAASVAVWLAGAPPRPALAPTVAAEPAPMPPVAAQPPPAPIRKPGPGPALRPTLGEVTSVRPETRVQDSEKRLRPGRRRLERLLRANAPEVAERQAFMALMTAWGRNVPIRAGASKQEITEILAANELAAVDLMGISGLIAFDSPAIIPLATSDGSTRNTLVLRIEGNAALLDGLVPDQLVEIPLDVLRSLWVGPAWTVQSSSLDGPRLHVDPHAGNQLAPSLHSRLLHE